MPQPGVAETGAVLTLERPVGRLSGCGCPRMPSGSSTFDSRWSRPATTIAAAGSCERTKRLSNRPDQKATTVRTYSPKTADIQRERHSIDATDVVLGRLAVQTATLLRGKHKPTFAPHMDGGDFVIIVNAAKVALTGNKRQTEKVYRHSGYPGGLTEITIGDLLEK